MATLFSIVLATIPPDGSENPILFVTKIVLGTTLFLGAGLAFYLRRPKDPS